jgi:hypothetical protein
MGCMLIFVLPDSNKVFSINNRATVSWISFRCLLG